MKSRRTSRTRSTPAWSGRDLVEAAKGNLVFRRRDGGRMAVLTKERVLTLKLRPEAVASYEALEMARVFGLRPGLSAYKVRSELAGVRDALRAARQRHPAAETCGRSCK